MKNKILASVTLFLILITNNFCFAESEEYYINTGKEYLYKENTGKAIEYLQKAIELNPKSAEAHLWIGLAYKENRLYDEAIVEFTKMLSLDPSFTKQYYMGTGDTYLAKGLEDKAIEAYEKLISIEPNYDTCTILYDLYKKKDSLDKAIVCFQKVIENNPNMAAAYRALGGAYGDTSRYKEAEKEFKKAIELDPNNLEYHSALGLNCVALQKWEDALQEYFLLKSAPIQKEYDPEALEYAIILGRIFGTTKTRGGLHIVGQIEQFPKEEFEQLWEYFNRAKNSDNAQAIQIIKESLNIKETATAHYLLGEIYLEMKNCNESINHLEKAKELKNENSLIYITLSKAYTQCKGRKEGLNILEEFLKKYPKDILATWQSAKMYFAYRDWQNSIKMLEELKNLDEIIFALMEDDYKIAKENLINKK